MARTGHLLGYGLLLIAATFVAGLRDDCGDNTERPVQGTKQSAPDTNDRDIRITVTYDNNPFKKGLRTGWGLSCVITGTEKTILFDTGGDGSLLLGNMTKLGIEPNSIQIVVLSHIHGDHTGGLERFLEINPDVSVYVPKSFPDEFKDKVRAYGAEVWEVEEPSKICKDAYTTGQLGTWIKEQSLIIRTDKGLVVITGCAHPGIVRIVEHTKNSFDGDVLLVMGGFHLQGASEGSLESIVSAFEKAGVRYAGPCHCSGDRSRSVFKRRLGTNYVDVGVGRVIAIRDLEVVEYKPIGIIHSPFKGRVGVPRQAAGAPQTKGKIKIYEEYATGLKDLAGFSHIVVVFHMHLVQKPSLIACPPWNGKEHGVFATRSPYRPNPIGISVVRLEKVDDTVLHISGVDMIDGTPVLDIKPYIPDLNPVGTVRTGWLTGQVEGMNRSKSGDR